MQCRNKVRMKGLTKGRDVSKDVKANQHQLQSEQKDQSTKTDSDVEESFPKTKYS